MLKNKFSTWWGREWPVRRLYWEEQASSWSSHYYPSSIWLIFKCVLHRNSIVLLFYFAFLWLLMKWTFIRMWIIFIFFFASLPVEVLRVFLNWFGKALYTLCQSLAIFIARSHNLTFTSVYHLSWQTEFLNYHVVNSTFFLQIFFHCFRETILA